MQVAGRELASAFLQLVGAGAAGLVAREHVRLLRGAAALGEVAAGAGGDDVLPRRAPPTRPRHHVVKGQVRRRVTVLAGEGVAQEQVEPGEGRGPVLGHVLLQRHDAGQLHGEGWGVDFLVVGGDHVDPVEEHRLDHILPGPERQRIVAERAEIGVQHEAGPAGRGVREHLHRRSSRCATAPDGYAWKLKTKPSFSTALSANRLEP